MTHVAVVGAGIGGLATALVLRGRGLDVTILDQARSLEPIGAGIQLSANANHVLDRIGVLDAVAAHAFEPQALQIIEGISGRLLIAAPLSEWARERYGQPYLNVHRGDLQSVLLDALTKDMAKIELGCRVIDLRQVADKVELTVEDGRSFTTDVVVGADGVHSVIRGHVTGVEPPRFTGHVAYRMLIPRSALSESDVPPPMVTLRLGPHGHVVSYWVRGGAAYNIVATIEDHKWRDDSWSIPAELDDVRQAYRQWDKSIHRLFDHAHDIHK
jgi:salicylate hydroxylase